MKFSSSSFSFSFSSSFSIMAFVSFVSFVVSSSADPITNYPIAIPHGTNYAAWWTNSTASTATNLTLREAVQTMNTNFAWVSGQLSALPDAHTNSLLCSPGTVNYTTNYFTSTYGTTNILPWNITNLASFDYTFSTVNADGSANYNKPVVLWSTNNGTTWHKVNQPIPPMLGPIKIALSDHDKVDAVPPVFQVPVNPIISNLVVKVMSRPDLFVKTNHIFAQTVLVDTPSQSYQVANKGYVDDLFQQTAWWNAENDVQLNDHKLHLNSSWKFYSTATNDFHLSWIGTDALVITHPEPLAKITNLSLSLDGTGTNLVCTVPTNGLAASPRIRLSRYINPANWQYLDQLPTLTGTNWVFTFPQPWPDTGYMLSVVPSPDPGVLSVTTLLLLQPRTVTNATSTTWGRAGGLLCVDSNYLYISVGTNLWKRVGLSGW